VKLPVASLAQLDFKLRRLLREVSMMRNILPNHITSRTVSNCARKIPILSQFPRPKSFFQPCTLLLLKILTASPMENLSGKDIKNVDVIIDTSISIMPKPYSSLISCTNCLARFRRSSHSKIFFRYFGHHTKW